MTDVLLTVAAWLWVNRRGIAELVGLGLIVAAAAAYNPLIGILAGGIALILAANYGGR